MKINKSQVSLVEDASLIMLGEKPIQNSTVQKMFNQCVRPTTHYPKSHTLSSLVSSQSKKQTSK